MDKILFHDDKGRIHLCYTELNGGYRLVWTACNLYVPVQRAYISETDVPTCDVCLSKQLLKTLDEADLC